MPTVLKVQGVELDVAAADWEPVRLGQVARSFSGAVRSSVRATKRDHHFRGDAGGMTVATAELVRALVEGEGHAWSFDDATDQNTLLSSSRGLLPYQSGSVSDVVGKYGNGATFSNGEADTKWAVDYDGSGCTLLYWAKESGVWVHYLVRPGDGATWRNTTRTDSDPEYFTMSTTGVGADLVCPTSTMVAQFDADDLVCVPYEIPDEWALSLIAFRASSAWAPLPYVTAEGDAFPRGAAKCLGQVGTAQRVPLRSSGSFVLGELVDFTLQER